MKCSAEQRLALPQCCRTDATYSATPGSPAPGNITDCYISQDGSFCNNVYFEKPGVYARDWTILAIIGFGAFIIDNVVSYFVFHYFCCERFFFRSLSAYLLVWWAILTPIGTYFLVTFFFRAPFLSHLHVSSEISLLWILDQYWFQQIQYVVICSSVSGLALFFVIYLNERRRSRRMWTMLSASSIGLRHASHFL